MSAPPRVLVVGAGAAGSAAASHLTRAGSVEVVVVGAERRMPYNRTAVNKGLLSGAVTDDDITLPDVDDLPVQWKLGCRATALDPDGRSVTLGGGETITADALILTTGAVPRALPAPVAPAVGSRVLNLRTVEDTRRLRHLLAHDAAAPRTPRHVVVVGAGLLGTESAGLLRQVGHRVTLVDPKGLSMMRHVGATVAGWIRAEHQRAGVEVRHSRVVAVQQGGVTADATAAVAFDEGQDIEADAVLVSLGVYPATDWLSDGLPFVRQSRADAAGAQVHEEASPAVLVDTEQRVPGCRRIYAAGDLAAVPGPHATALVVEHWGAAVGQGRVAAAAALADLGIAHPSAAQERDVVPSYSTYVHGTKLTVVGWPHRGVSERPALGRPGDPRFAVALLDTDGRVVAAVGVGGARAANQLRPLIARGAPAADLPTADQR